MSRVVDERVVSMQFDNRHFESNVKTTMSTLDKLKQSLNLRGATKGLEEVNTAAKGVNMAGLGTAVESVSAKFSALQVMGVTALANITNSAVNAGKRIVSALTIDPVKTGFQEYETQINAVQTILANTESKGSTLDDVNTALEELNKYADQTIYNFTEMTRNIGTFTAAGVDLDTSVNAIKGIANLAAVSGSTSQQASTAMYQLSQALASGTVKLMDWNSVVNAGMGGQVFQDALKETARVHGVAIDQMIEEQGSFRETLSDGWLTSEILTETLQKFTLATEGLTDAEIEQNRQMLKAKGYTDEQIDSIFKLGDTATNAATKVKTFSQMWDVIKESVQSGWAQTWKIIFGDFEEAKALFTPLTNFFTGIIQKFSDFRNKLLEGALGSPLGKLAEKLGTFTSTTGKAVDKMKDYGDIVNKVIRGDFGNGQERWDKLTKAGYDWAHVQNLVNEKLGVNLRRITSVTEAQTDQTGKTVELTDAKLKELGLTEQEIEAYRALEKQAKETGVPINELIESMDKPDGRTLLIESLKNAGIGLVAVFTAIKDAWQDVFPPKSVDERAASLYNLIEKINAFSQKFVDFAKGIKENDETAQKLNRTLKGVFALIDIITTVTGGALKFAFQAITKILGAFDLDILDVTAHIGDAIVKVRDWIDNNNLLMKGLDFIIPYLKTAVTAIKDWIAAFKESHGISGSLIDGFVNGLKSGIKTVVTKVKELGTKILETLRGVLGIHSPSKETYEDGRNVVFGFVDGLKSAGKFIWDAIKTIGKKIVELFGEIDLGSIITVGLGGGLVAGFIKIAKALTSFATPFEAAGGVFENLADLFDKKGRLVKNVVGTLKAFKNNLKTESLKNIAVSLAILVGAFALLTLIDTDKIWPALGVITALSAILVGLSFAINAIGGSNTINIVKFAILITSFGTAMLMLAAVMKIIATMEWSEIDKATVGMGALGILIGALIAVAYFAGPNVNKVGKMITKISFALLLLVGVAKLASMLSPEEFKSATDVLTWFGSMIVILIAATQLAGNDIDKAGSTILKISAAMLLLIAVAKTIVKMEWSELGKAAVGLAGLGGIIVGLIAATKLAGNDIDKVGGTILKISAAILLLTIAAKMMSKMEWAELGKAAVGLLALGGIITGLVAATKLASDKELKRLGTTLISMSVAIALLAGVTSLLGMLKTEQLAKGIIAAGILAGLMALMIFATSNAKDCSKNIIAMTIGIVAISVAAAVLAMIDPNKLANAVLAITVLMGAFALMVAATGNGQKMLGNLIVMTVAIGVMAGAIYLLSGLPVESTIGSAIALSLLMAAMAGVLVIVSKFSGTASKSLLGVLALTAMAVPLIAFVGVLYAMQNVQNALSNVLALTILAAAMTVLLIPLAGIGALATTALLGVLALTAMAVPLIAFVGVLAVMQNVNNAMSNVVALSLLTTVLTVLLLPLSLVGALVAPALLGVLALTAMAVPLIAFVGVLAVMQNVQNATTNTQALVTLATVLTLLLIPLSLVGALIAPALLGVLGLTAMAVPMLAFVGVLALMQNIQNATENATALTTLMSVMTGLLVVLALVGPFALSAVTGVLALTGVILVVGALAVAVGALMEKFPVLESFLDTGIPVLEKLAYAVGSLLSNFAAGLTDGLPAIGTNLSSFMTNLKPFIDGVKTVDASVFEGVRTLTKSILALTAANIIDSIASWLTGGSSFADFGVELKKFGNSLVNYSDSVSLLNIEAINNSVVAVEELAKLASILPKSGGLLSVFTADNDLSTFGSELKKFGKSLADYSEKVAGISTTALSSSTTQFSRLVNLAKDAEGVDFGGLSSFGKSLGKIGKSGVDKFIDAFEDAYDDASEAGKEIAEAIIDGLNKGETSLTDAGKKLLTALASGIKNNKSAVLTAFTSTLTSSLTTIRGYYDNFSVAGSYLVDGFAAGISSRLWKAEARARAMARAADAAARDELKVRSPSKVAKETGSYYGEGFVKGVDGWVDPADRTARDMANAVVDGVKDELDINSPSKVAMELGEFTGGGFDEGLKKTIEPISLTAKDLARTVEGSLVKTFEKATESMADMYNEQADTVDDGEETLLDKLLNWGKEKVETVSNTGKDEVEAAEETAEGVVEAEETIVASVEALAKKRAALQDETLSNEKDYWRELLAAQSEGQDDQLASAKSALMDHTALFSDVNKKDEAPTADSLTANLKNQVNELSEFGEVMASLFTRLEGTSLQSVIANMGMDSLEELKALNSMTDAQLSEYVHLYDTKFAMAEEAASIHVTAMGEDSSKMIAFQEELVSKTSDLLDTYTSKLQSNTDALMDRSNIFKAVAEDEEVISSMDLTDNLLMQIHQMREYETTMSSLNTRLDGTALQSTIAEMGVESLTELKALNSMTDQQLSEYVKLYDTKYSLCEDVAKLQLSSLKEETEKELGGLFGGVNIELDTLITEFDGTFESLKTYIDGEYEVLEDDAYTAGTDMVSGFVLGIEDNITAAAEAAAKMASAAKEAAQFELDEHSPSRIFFKIGAYAVQGFVNAFTKHESDSYAAGSDIAKAAKTGLSDAISRIKDMVESDIDSQPTIRPVLDLTDIRAGAGAINGMFGMQPSVGLLSSVGSISTMMNGRRNTNNDDIISAIKDLDKDIRDSAGDTYIVNGVTYDDGTNVSDAVGALVRAVKIERRT